MGNSAEGYGYGCALPKLVERYRAAWSAVPGTTAPLAPFGIVTLAANTNEGGGQRVAGMRWSQTGNYGVLPNAIMPATFLAQGFDIGDVNVVQALVACCATVARCYKHFLHLIGLGNLPRQSVLAATAADNKYVHSAALFMAAL
jgi:hypothetical protein